MIFLLLATGLALAEPAVDPLDAVARTATIMVDGDVCERIETPRSREYHLKKDPRDAGVPKDNFDVDHNAYTQTKKTLMRLAKLCPAACDVNLWMPVSGDARRIQILIRNVYEMSAFWTWGAFDQPVPEEMKRVLATGERVTYRGKPGSIAVLAPVHNSLGDIVGLVEVVAQKQRDLRDNVK